MNTKDAHSELWEYIVVFQGIPFQLQITIQLLLNKNGLKNNFWTEEKRDILSRIILAERSVYQLLKIYESLINELFGENELIVIRPIIKKIKEYIEKHRNDIIHAYLFVSNEGQDLIINREKFGSSKWFQVLSDLPRNHLARQINVIKHIRRLLYIIHHNIENNYKISWKFTLKDLEVTITEDNIKNAIKLIEEETNNLEP